MPSAEQFAELKNGRPYGRQDRSKQRCKPGLAFLVHGPAKTKSPKSPCIWQARSILKGMETCPLCGQEFKKGLRACPHCGSDENTGWSDKTYLDNIDLGDDVDYDELVKDEFPESSPAPAKIRWTTIAGIVVLFFFLAALLKIFL
jgi:hypothetical protein